MSREIREATVIMARCSKSKRPYGIRVEKKTDEIWYCTWAFNLSEKAAANEGYSDTMVSGRMALDVEYPGCPYCGASGWFSCGVCGRLTCQGTETHVKCSWCGNEGETVASDTFNLKGGGY